MNGHLYFSAQLFVLQKSSFHKQRVSEYFRGSWLSPPLPFLLGPDTFESLMPLGHMYTSAINHNVANESTFRPAPIEGLIFSLLLIIPFILC